MSTTENGLPPKAWHYCDGKVISCTEKVKVLEENWFEIKAALQDALDDAVLMGCTKKEVKTQYKRLIDELDCRYLEKTAEEVKELD